MMSPDAKGKGEGQMTAELFLETGAGRAGRLGRHLEDGVPRPLNRPTTGWFRVQEATKKICVLGDPAVGKTSLIRRYALDCFDEGYLTTVGARILSRTQVLRFPGPSAELRLKLKIWEISGQNRHIELYPSYYLGAEGAVIVGDATRVETQVNLWKWIEGFRAAAGRVPIILLVNKTDLLDQVDFDLELMDDISREFGCPFRMSSARNGANVENVFRELAYHLAGRTPLTGQRRGRAC
jgi:small GTP-binding protein